MKLAVHMSMFCRTWTDDIRPFFPKLKEMGFDGVEISLFGADWSCLRSVFIEARNNGLDIICGTGISTETDVSSKDAAVRQAGIQYLNSAVDLAAEYGAEFINGVLYAPWQVFALDEPLEERWKRSADSLHVVGEHAKKAGIGLNCEVLNRFETDFLNTLDEGSRFVHMIGLDNVKLLADTFHMNIEEKDICQALTSNIRNIGCVHICENHRGVPGTGHLNWRETVSTLEKAGYDQYLDMETFVEAGTEVGTALGIRRSSGLPPLEEAANGAAYMKKIMH